MDLFTFQNLQVLDIASNYIGPEKAVSLAVGLVHFSHLQELGLQDNIIGDVGAFFLAAGLMCMFLICNN